MLYGPIKYVTHELVAVLAHAVSALAGLQGSPLIKTSFFLLG